MFDSLQSTWIFVPYCIKHLGHFVKICGILFRFTLEYMRAIMLKKKKKIFFNPNGDLGILGDYICSHIDL